ncbi:unnamed protein product [Urochloa decumbens]|uniref:Uncharacterized protein n=2 Tax=Urochloa decumbens TaxID=240449 RepID=A0ABC9ABS8_9POAL
MDLCRISEQHANILRELEIVEQFHEVDIPGDSQDTSGKNSSNKEKEDDRLHILPIDIDKLTKRIRAFTGAFVVMISPILLGIVLKKVNLAGAGKYQGIRMLEVFVDFVQGWFPHLAAATLQIGILPFLCVMISEPCASYIAPRVLAASKVLVFFSNISLMILGCGILLLIHKEAWLVLSLCSIMVIIVIVEHITTWFRYRRCVNIGGTKPESDEYHSKLEHLLDLSAGITVMMFLVLECVVLEGLLRNNSQGQAGLLPMPLAPAPSEYPTAKGQETFLGGTLLISFVFSMIGVFLMNVWTTPHVRTSNNVVLATNFIRGLSSIVQALPIAVVVILITLDVLPQAWKPAAWLPVFPPFVVLLMLLLRPDCGDGTQPNRKEEGKAAGGEEGRTVAGAGDGPVTGSSSSRSAKAQHPNKPEDHNKSKKEEPEDQKPVPLELTKVAFTGFLAVAMPSATNSSVGKPSIFFVLCTATAVLLGLLWRLLTHEAKPTAAVLKAANHASFCAHTFISFAGIAFGIMAVNASK